MKKICVLAVGMLFCLMAVEGRAAEGTYDVVYPIGKQMSEIQDVAPSLPDLNGKTVCEIWNYLFRGDECFEIIRELLNKNYVGVKVIPYTEFGNVHGRDELEVMAALPDKLKAFGCDAVISGNGG